MVERVDERVEKGKEEENVVVLTVVRLAQWIRLVAGRVVIGNDFTRRDEARVQLEIAQTLVEVSSTDSPSTDVNFQEELMDGLDGRQVPVGCALLRPPKLGDSILDDAGLDGLDSRIFVDAPALLPGAVDEDGSLEWKILQRVRLLRLEVGREFLLVVVADDFT